MGGTVEKALFSISCTTCQARLSVRSEHAIGAILECPKCGSMVQVVPPDGWEVDASPEDEPDVLESASAPTLRRKRAAAAAGIGAGVAAVASGEAAVGDGVVDTPSGDVGIPPAAEPGSLAPSGIWASPAELLWRKWVLLGTASVGGVVLAVGLWAMFFSSGDPEPTPEPVVEQPADPTPVKPPTPAVEQPEPTAAELDPRWLPRQAALVFSIRRPASAAEPDSGGPIGQIDDLWRPSIGAVLQGLGLELSDVARVTWASTDLSAWPERSVAVIELEKGDHARALQSAGGPVELSVGGRACRRLPAGPWVHPFAVLEGRTVVTGDAGLLGELPRGEGVELNSEVLWRLLQAAGTDADVTLLVDLGAAEAAGWELPTAVLDVWPGGRQPWHTLWELPEGIGCTLRWSDRLRSEVVLVCEGETAAQRVSAALDELVPAAGKAISGRLAELPERLEAGRMTAAAAQQYELLLKAGLAASKSAQWRVAGRAVLVHLDWPQRPSALSAAAIGSRPAIDSDWLSAASQSDRANYGRLLGGLGGYGKAEGHFPPAAAGGALMAPETGLSWIAQTLPYFGYPEWHRRLKFDYPWNGPQNRQITGQPLPEAVNPVLGPGRTEAGFPVTHYVGIAGVGPDAARLKAGDPRAGVFGYGRTTRPEDIADGASNTIAVLGVTERLGPWAAGGDSTVRALTKRPYIGGPDGFGSGQPDGMFAGMADGSVRFVSNGVDPRVLEQLATAGGRERVTAVALGPPPDGTPPKPDPPRPGTEGPPDEPPDGPPDEPPDGPGVRPILPQVDVKAQLAQTIPQINLVETPLAEAVGLLSAMSTVPVTFDPEALTHKRVLLHEPVSVELSGASMGRILEAVVSSRGLAAVVENGQVLITSPQEYRQTLQKRRYTVSDLTGSDAAAPAELAALVEKLVAVDTWRAGGGRGTIRPQPGVLMVIQTAAVHEEILVFCEKLRTARRMPLRSRQAPARFTLATRRDRARQALRKPVSVNFHEPTPLIDVLAYLGRLAETDVLVDRLALGTAGLSDRVPATLKVQKQPMAAALDQLLRPLGLAYRAVDARTLQVTTQEAVAARLELEFYRVGELLGEGRTGPELVEWIKGRLAGSSWSDAGGPGVMHFDRPSGCLIVLQSQPVQAALGQLLAEKMGSDLVSAASGPSGR